MDPLLFFNCSPEQLIGLLSHNKCPVTADDFTNHQGKFSTPKELKELLYGMYASGDWMAGKLLRICVFHDVLSIQSSSTKKKSRKRKSPKKQGNWLRTNEPQCLLDMNDFFSQSHPIPMRLTSEEEEELLEYVLWPFAPTVNSKAKSLLFRYLECPENPPLSRETVKTLIYLRENPSEFIDPALVDKVWDYAISFGKIVSDEI